MLLRFSVANHLSLRDEQELLLTADTRLKEPSHTQVIECEGVDGGQVLPLAILYGANASGKSNVVAALRFMRNAILFSQRRWEPEGGIERYPFALGEGYEGQPSFFEADILVDSVRYQYGFEISNNEFSEEWLYKYPNVRPIKLFERKNMEFFFGRSLKGEKNTIKKLTRSNSLFLSSAAQNKHPELTRVFDAFRKMRGFEQLDVSPHDVIEFFSRRGGVDDRIMKFMKYIDTGVVSYDKETRHISEEEREKYYAPIKEEYRDYLPKLMEKYINIRLMHLGEEVKEYPIELAFESAGTLRLLVILANLFDALDQGVPFVLDEIDSSLHTLAIEKLMQLFTSHETNPNGAQLIATTHNTNLLNSSTLRRDEVWLTEKDRVGATRLYQLLDFGARKDENLEKGYLSGRFGAIPYSGPVIEILGESEARGYEPKEEKPASQKGRQPT